jgi:hypothetical protein
VKISPKAKNNMTMYYPGNKYNNITNGVKDVAPALYKDKSN